MKTATKTRKSAKATKIASKKSGKVAHAVPVAATPKKSDPKPCWCGCGGETKNRFNPGHDARLVGLSKRVARGQVEEHIDEISARLPHDDARDHFHHHVEAERKVLAASTKAEKAIVDKVAKAAKKK